MRVNAIPKKIWWGAVAACVLAVPLFLSRTRLSGPPCLFRLSTGLPCPGCGMTRSLIALWHGDLLTSFRYHPLGPPLFLFCALLLAALLLRRPPQLPPAVQRRLLPGVFGLLVGTWLLRLTLYAAGNRFFLW